MGSSLLTAFKCLDLTLLVHLLYFVDLVNSNNENVAQTHNSMDPSSQFKATSSPQVHFHLNTCNLDVICREIVLEYTLFSYVTQ